MFKANLFLGAGSVMHGMKNRENMRRYGALRAAMLVTWLSFMAATFAIMGIPPFSGFWSKDDIIHAAFEHNIIIGICAILAAGFTGFYMTRMLVMTFFGKARWEDDQHPHESPPVMTIPLIILGIGSIFTGIGLLFWGNIQTWLEPITGFETRELAIPAIVLEGITLLVVLVGAAVAIAMYRRSVAVEAPKGNVLVRAARNSMYDDAINDTIAVRPTYWLSRSLVWADRSVIDGIVGGSAAFVGGLSGRMRRLQSGFARSYALAMLGGAILVVVVMLLVRLP